MNMNILHFEQIERELSEFKSWVFSIMCLEGMIYHSVHRLQVQKPGYTVK